MSGRSRRARENAAEKRVYTGGSVLPADGANLRSEKEATRC